MRNLSMPSRFDWPRRRRVAALALFACALPLPARGESSTEGAFQAWSKDVAKRQHLEICRWGQLTNPVTKEAGYFVWFTHKLGTNSDADETYDENNSFAFIVFATGDRKWIYGDVEEDALVLKCEQQNGAFEKLEKLQLDRSDTLGGHNWEYRTVTMDAAMGPVVLAEEDGHNQGGDDTRVVDWVNLTRKSESGAGSSDEVGGSSEGAVFLVEKEDAPKLVGLPPARTYVTFGKKAWSGDADASMKVQVTGAGGKIRAVLKIQDDKFVPVSDGTDAHALLRCDHVEVWFCQGATAGACGDSQVRQFGFALPTEASAPIKPIWLYPAKVHGTPPARVTSESGSVLIDLDVAAMGIKKPSSKWRMPFTVVFSDSDDAKAGQQTLVATSNLRRRDPGSFGLIVGGVEQRFPSLGRVADFESKLGRKIRKGR